MPDGVYDIQIGNFIVRCAMDLGLLKVVSDLGTVAILLFVLIRVLDVLNNTLNRVIGLLEREIEEDTDKTPKKA